MVHPARGSRGPALVPGPASPPPVGARALSGRRRAWALRVPSSGAKPHPVTPQGLKAVVKPPGGGTGLPRLGVPGARLGASGWLLVVPEVVGMGKSWQE